MIANTRTTVLVETALNADKIATFEFADGLSPKDTLNKYRGWDREGTVGVTLDLWKKVYYGTFDAFVTRYGKLKKLGNIYEILSSSPEHSYNLMPYFDIEFYHNLEIHIEYIKTFCARLTEFCKEKFGKDPKLVVLDSLNEERKKVSYHVIVRKCGYLTNIRDCYKFYANFINTCDEFLMNQPKENNEMGCPIDPLVYNQKSQLMRLPYMAKKEYPNVHLKFMTGKWETIEYERIRTNENFAKFIKMGFISYVKGELEMDLSGFADVEISKQSGVKSGLPSSNVWDIYSAVNTEGETSPIEFAHSVEFYLSCIPVKQTKLAWIMIAMACKNDSEDNYVAYKKWSSEYNGFDVKECRKVWEGIDRNEKGYNFCTLMRVAKKCRPDLFVEEEPDTFILNPEEFNIRHINCKYVSDGVELTDFDNFKCINIQSMMGTGKSKTFRDIIHRDKPKSALFLTSRRIYARSLHTELKDAGIKSGLYLENYGKLENINYLVLELESLMKISEDRTYEYVFMDESESLLAIFNQETLRTQNSAFDQLSRILRSAKKVIVGDAFTSLKTREFLQAHFEKDEMLEIVNDYLPPKRDVVELKNFKDLQEKLYEKLSAGFKCVFVCGSKNKAEGFYGQIKDEFDAKFYYGAMNDSEKKTLNDVVKEWSNTQIVIYTPCITCGVNFSKPDVFDYLFMYANPRGSSCRNDMQAAMRVRHFNKSTIYFASGSELSGRDPETNFERLYERVKRNLKDQFDSEIEDYKLRVLARDLAEINRSRNFYTGEFMRYAAKMNWVIRVGKEIKKNALKNLDGIEHDFDELAISDETYDRIKYHVNTETAEAYFKYQAAYYQMWRHFEHETVAIESRVAEHYEYDPAYHYGNLGFVNVEYKSPAKELIDAKFQGYCSGKIRGKIIQCKFEKSGMTDAEIETLSNKNDKLLRSNLLARIKAVRKLCAILGMNDSHSDPHITDENKPEIIRGVFKLKKEICNVFGIEEKLKNKKWERVMAFVNAVLGRWGFGKIESIGKRIRCGKTRKWVYTYKMSDDSKKLYAAINEYKTQEEADDFEI